jgi:hypothetical protein
MLHVVYFVRLKTYIYLDLHCNIDAIAMITIFYTVVLSTDPGNGIDAQKFCLLIRQGATLVLQMLLLLSILPMLL